MGWSGKTGTAELADTTRNDDSSYSLSGEGDNVYEVTEWTAEDAAKVHKYGHSESEGFQDTCVGTCSLSGTVEVKLSISGLDLTGTGWSVYAGSVVGLTLQNAAVTLSGMAVFETVPFSTKVDGGDPVSASYRWTSKGHWTYAEGTKNDGN